MYHRTCRSNDRCVVIACCFRFAVAYSPSYGIPATKQLFRGCIPCHVCLSSVRMAYQITLKLPYDFEAAFFLLIKAILVVFSSPTQDSRAGVAVPTYDLLLVRNALGSTSFSKLKKMCLGRSGRIRAAGFLVLPAFPGALADLSDSYCTCCGISVHCCSIICCLPLAWACVAVTGGGCIHKRKCTQY